jgi:ribosomal protein S18 acetylase RimI-like enzyme
MIVSHLKSSQASQAAALHISGISTGFISSLGHDFVAALYEAIAEDRSSFGFVALENERVLGFVAFSTNLSGLYRHVILKKGFRFLLLLGRKMFSARTARKICANVFYPHRMKRMRLPDAELLSIAVAPDGRGKGIAKSLIEAGFGECRRRNIAEVKVLVAAANEPANNLYQRMGFQLVGQIDNHGVLSNIYVARTGSGT